MSDATSAPIPLRIGSEEFYVSKLSIKDVEELDNWVKGKYITAARQSFTDDMSRDDRAELLDAAMRVAATLSFTSPQGLRLFATLQGVAKLFEVSVRERAPDMNYQRACEILMAPDALEGFQLCFDELNRRRGRRPANPIKLEDRKRRKREKKRRRA